MTTNHHTPIAIGAPANASTFNSPLGQLDNAITNLATDVSDAVSDVATNTTTLNNLVSGASGFTQLNLSTSTTLTISGGAITVTRSRHLVDTEASASYDDLDTINGGVAGDVLVLQSVTSARVVVVKNGTGNIFLNGFDVFLDNPRKAVTLLYDGTQWVLVGEAPKQIDRKLAQILFMDGSSSVIGHPAISSSGTASNSFEAEGAHTNYTCTATTSSLAGVASSGSSIFQPRANPILTLWMKTGSSIAGMRWYIGFHTGSIYGAADNLAGTGVSGVVLRYSTVAGDSGFRPVTSNGTTQTVGTALHTLAISTIYKIQIAIINGVAYFSINDSVPTVVSATMPSSTASCGWSVHLQTQENVAKSVLYRKILLEMN